MYLMKRLRLQLGIRRSYWTASTFRSGSALNLVDAVEQAVSTFASVPTPAKGTAPVLLFAISKHLPSMLLARLVDKFQNLAPTLEPIGVLAQDVTPGLFSVSIATWSGISNELVPFTSTIASRAPIAVGREIIPPLKTELPTSTHHQSSYSLTTEYQGHAHQTNESSGYSHLPIELQTIPPSSIKSFIFFSAPSPQPFLKTLEKKFPSANLMGLVGSSTIFHTGRRSTLFRNGSIMGEEGAVGVAVLNRTDGSFSTPLIRYPGMETLGSPMQVTHSRGNIILTLNSKKATVCLLEILEKSNEIHQFPTSSDSILPGKKQFYLGFLDCEKQIIEVNRITGGSTSRGTMSLDREREIPHHHFVQLIYFPENVHDLAACCPPEAETKEGEVLMEFECCNQSFEDHNVSRDERGQDLVQRIDGLFSAGSEFGFIPRHQQIVDINHSKTVLELPGSGTHRRVSLK